MTAVSRPKRPAPIAVLYANAQLQPPTGQSSRPGHYSRWLNRRDAHKHASTNLIPSLVAPSSHRAERKSDIA